MPTVRITLERCPKHVDEMKIRQAVQFYADTLMPRFNRLINVTVRWTYSKPIKVAELEMDDIDRTRSKFTILISSRRRGWQIYQWIAHEMVHVRQWTTRTLRYYETDDYVRWKGKRYRWDQDTIAYWDSPWEREAMSLECGLYAKFKEAHGYKGTDLAALK